LRGDEVGLKCHMQGLIDDIMMVKGHPDLRWNKREIGDRS